jgi:hypothetical protein
MKKVQIDIHSTINIKLETPVKTKYFRSSHVDPVNLHVDHDFKMNCIKMLKLDFFLHEHCWYVYAELNGLHDIKNSI